MLTKLDEPLKHTDSSVEKSKHEENILATDKHKFESPPAVAEFIILVLIILVLDKSLKQPTLDT